MGIYKVLALYMPVFLYKIIKIWILTLILGIQRKKIIYMPKMMKASY